MLCHLLSMMSGHGGCGAGRETGMVHTDRSECMQMCVTTCWRESTSWKCMGMDCRVLGGVVAMQVGTGHH